MKLTSKVRAIRQAGGDLSIVHNDVHYPLLYEVHFSAECALFDNDVTRLKYLIFQLSDDVIYKICVRVREERDRCDQCATVVIYDVLKERKKKNMFNMVESTSKQASNTTILSI